MWQNITILSRGFWGINSNCIDFFKKNLQNGKHWEENNRDVFQQVKSLVDYSAVCRENLLLMFYPWKTMLIADPHFPHN